MTDFPAFEKQNPVLREVTGRRTRCDVQAVGVAPDKTGRRTRCDERNVSATHDVARGKTPLIYHLEGGEGGTLKPADLILAALVAGPATARELSQRIDGISYDNIRQLLTRMAKSGVVTKVKRGVYGLPAIVTEVAAEGWHNFAPQEAKNCDMPIGTADCDTDSKQSHCDNPVVTDDCDTGGCDKPTAPKSGATIVTPWPGQAFSENAIRIGVAAAFADFNAMNDPHSPEAWQ